MPGAPRTIAEERAIYLDASAISGLLKDVYRDQLVRFLVDRRVTVRISATNFIEVAATMDSVGRQGLLRTCRELGQDNIIMAPPTEILLRSLRAYAEGHQTMNWSVGPEMGWVWQQLQNPSELTAADREEIFAVKAKEEAWYRAVHENARPHLQVAVQKAIDEGAPWATSRLGWLRSLKANEKLQRDFLRPLFKRVGFDVERALRRRQSEVIDQLAAWMFFFAAIAVGIYDRAVQQSDYGHKVNPGSLDTQQAIYLGACSTFVTEDRRSRQLQVMRLLGRLVKPYRRVLPYQDFRERILGALAAGLPFNY